MRRRGGSSIGGGRSRERKCFAGITSSTTSVGITRTVNGLYPKIHGLRPASVGNRAVDPSLV